MFPENQKLEVCICIPNDKTFVVWYKLVVTFQTFVQATQKLIQKQVNWLYE